MQRITYSSDLVIREPGLLSSLCLVYDTVNLPHFGGGHPGAMLRMQGGTNGHPVYAASFHTIDDGWYFQWDSQHQELFRAGVLRRLDAPAKSVIVDDDSVETILTSLYPNADFPEPWAEGGVRMWLVARIVHLLRPDHECPCFVHDDGASFDRGVFRSLMALEAFRVLLPRLPALHPDELLALRDRTAATREGFGCHLDKLSRLIDDRIRNGASLADARQIARSATETELIPDYREFVRQIRASRVRSISNTIGDCIEPLRLLATSGTGGLPAWAVQMLSKLIPGAAERDLSRASNQQQAYRFLHTLSTESAPAT